MTSADFKKLRVSTGLTQQAFGLLAGMSQQNVNRIENGARQPTNIHGCVAECLAFINERKLLNIYTKRVEANQ